MLSDDQVQPGMIAGDRMETTEKLDNNQTVMAEIVEIDGTPLKWRMGTKLRPRESPADRLNVGDALELRQTIEPRQQ
jgi:hypothetical protein